MRRVLLDESLPRRLKSVLDGYDIVTMNEAGWAGVSNGELLRLAADRFDVFLTGDKNLQHQQNLSKFSVGIVVVGGYSTKLGDLLPLVPGLREAIENVPPGRLVIVQPD